jgi:hypothetical protein
MQAQPPTLTVEKCASVFSWVAVGAAAIAAAESIAANRRDKSEGDPITADDVLGLASYMGYDEKYINMMLGETEHPALSTEYIFKYDSDGDGELSLTELNNALNLEGFNIQLSENAFSFFDTVDRDGKLSADELDSMQRNDVGDELVLRKVNNNFILDIATESDVNNTKWMSQWDNAWRDRIEDERTRRKQHAFEQAERRTELKNQLKRGRDKVDDRLKTIMKTTAMIGGGVAAVYAGAEKLDGLIAEFGTKTISQREQAATKEGLQKALRMSEASEESSFHRDATGKIVPNDDEECPICGDVLLLKKWIIRRCGHAFCESCASEWGKRGHNTCPLCVQAGEDFNPEDGRKIYRMFPALRF